MTPDEEFNKDVADAEELDRAYVEGFFRDYSKSIDKPIPLVYDPLDPDKVIVTKGNFSVIRGQAKSYKSYLCSLFGMDYFEQQPSGLLLWIDTEQGDYHAFNIPRRICRGLKWNYEETYKSGKLILATMRSTPRRERAEAFKKMLRLVRHDNPDRPILVMLDGARDLVIEANDEVSSRDFADDLLALTADLDLGMLCIIHTRKDGTSSIGWTGGELEKKGEQIIEVEQRKGAKGGHVKCLPSRNPEFDEFDFGVDVHGVPYRVNAEPKTILPKLGTPRETKALNAIIPATRLREEWVAEIMVTEGCGRSTAEKWVADFIASGYLIPTDKQGHHFAHWLVLGKDPQPPQKSEPQALPIAEEYDPTINSMNDPDDDPFA